MSDSRQFGELAKAVDRPELREKLKQGRNLLQVIEEGRSASDRISEGLVRATEGLTTVSGLIVEGALGTDEALKLHKLCKEKTMPTARKISSDLFKVASGTADNDED